MSTCVLATPNGCELRIIRKISKAEVGAVARYCAIVSTDKLVEALSFPLINQRESNAIEAELDARLCHWNGTATVA